MTGTNGRFSFAVRTLFSESKRRHPDDTSQPARDADHVLDRGRVDAADRTVQRNAAQHLNPGSDPGNNPGKRGRRIVVVLQHDRAHASRLRQPGDLDGVNGARPIVGRAVDMDVDRPGEHRPPVPGVAALACEQRRGTGEGCDQERCDNRSRQVAVRLRPGGHEARTSCAIASQSLGLRLAGEREHRARIQRFGLYFFFDYGITRARRARAGSSPKIAMP